MHIHFSSVSNFILNLHRFNSVQLIMCISLYGPCSCGWCVDFFVIVCNVFNVEAEFLAEHLH